MLPLLPTSSFATCQGVWFRCIIHRQSLFTNQSCFIFWPTLYIQVWARVQVKPCRAARHQSCCYYDREPSAFCFWLLYSNPKANHDESWNLYRLIGLSNSVPVHCWCSIMIFHWKLKGSDVKKGQRSTGAGDRHPEAKNKNYTLSRGQTKWL